MKSEVFMKLGMNDSTEPGDRLYVWTGTLDDMGRVGVMLARDGGTAASFTSHMPKPVEPLEPLAMIGTPSGCRTRSR